MSGVIPAYKLISSAQNGLHLLVDGFQHAKKAPSGTLFFLTHAHSDHYTGIRADWSMAPIYCSQLTAQLVRHLLGVDPAYLRPLPLNLAVQLAGGVEVTLVDANHCPGAVLLLFRLPDGRRIVHTGDFRCSERMLGCPQLATFRGADALFLDTTYCNPKFRFCLQAESVEYVAATIERLLAEDAAAACAARRRLYLISTYVIGKERVLEAVARRCAVKIHADERKLGVLRCLGFPAKLLTADSNETAVHVVPWGLLGETWPFFRPNFKAPVDYAAEHGVAEVVGFVPTGWVHGMAKEPFSVRCKGACSVHLVPYSEHSSYQELLDFVGFVRPRQVIPTVGGDGDPSSKETAKLVAHFRHAVDSAAAKANFLKGMGARPPAAAGASAAKGGGEGSALESLQPLRQADGACVDNEADVAEVPGGADDQSVVTPAVPEAEAVAQLLDVSAGALNAERARDALQAAGGDLARAINNFLDMPPADGSAPEAVAAPPPPKAATAPRPAAGGGSAGKRRRSSAVLPAGQRSILAFLGGESSGAGRAGLSPYNQQQGRQQEASGEGPASPQLSGSFGPEGNLSAVPKRPKLAPPAAPASAPEVPSDAVRSAVGLPLEQYHPTRHAPWAASQPTPYLHLARTFHLLDSTTKRLKKSDVLVNAFRSVMALAPADLVSFAYLAVGRIAPDYEGLELSVGGSTVAAAVSEACGVSRARLREMHNEMGDMGDVAAACKRNQSTIFPPPPLTVAGLYGALRGLAGEKGGGAAARRQRTVLRLLRSCREAETKYLVRMLVGALRVGANWRSVVPALARALAIHDAQKEGGDGAPMPSKAQLRAAAAAATSAFHVCPNLELLIAALRAGPVAEVDQRCPLTPGIPIKPMLAKITDGVSDAVKQLRGGAFLAEYKYDGVRSQIHVMPGAAGSPAATVKVYSRNCEDRSGAFPDVAAAVLESARGGAKSFVIDAEIVAVERSAGLAAKAEAEHRSVRLRPFQELAGRARGDVALADIAVDVCVFVFDLLEAEGRSLLRLPLSERRRALRAALPAMRPGYVQLAQGHEVAAAAAAAHEQAVDGGGGASSSQEAALEGGGGGVEERVTGWLVEAIAAGTEGLMLKSLAATYEPSKRSDFWLKLKKDYCVGLHETLDLVPIGAWWGNGRKAGWFSPFLMAVWDPDSEELQSVCRVMSGFSDDFYKVATARLKETIIPGPRPYYQTGECPNVWFDALEVWEVRGADLTISPAHKASAGRVHPDRGIGLRFPRFLRIREDKGVEDATGADTIERMYRQQSGAVKVPSSSGRFGAAPGGESGAEESDANEEVVTGVEEV